MSSNNPFSKKNALRKAINTKESWVQKSLLTGSLLMLGAIASPNTFAGPQHKSGILNHIDSKKMTGKKKHRGKYRAAPADKAIEGQYIVVFNEEFVEEQTGVLIATQNDDDVNNNEINVASKKRARRSAIMKTSEDFSYSHNARVKRNFHAALPGFVANMSEESVQDLLEDERIAYIEQDQIVQANVTQSNATWGLDRIDQSDLPLNSSYTYNLNGSGVDAYIIDTGIYSRHSNLGGRVRSGFTAFNDGNGTEDCDGHGTHVAGTVGSSTYGVAKNVNLIPVRVLDCEGGGTNSGVIAGVEWVIDNASGPSLANMSLGGGNSTALDNAVQKGIDAGITFVVAAGNDTANACSGSPNKVPDALTIASSTSGDVLSSFSNFGSCIDMIAPGSNITSTWYTGGFETISGTSMAAPHVAGVVAQYLQANPSASPAQVEYALESLAARNTITNVKGSPNLFVQAYTGSTVTPPTTPSVDPINVSASNVSVAAGSWSRYTLVLEAGYSSFEVTTSGGTGDADLFVNFGSQSTTTNYDCKSESSSNSEICSFNNPPSGTWHIDIYGYSDSSGITVRATAD